VITARSPSFWRDAFSLRKDDRGCLLCPKLFKAAADDILEAGKASLLLHAENRYILIMMASVHDCPSKSLEH